MKNLKRNIASFTALSIALCTFTSCEKDQEPLSNSAPASIENAISADPAFYDVPDTITGEDLGATVQSDTFSYGSFIANKAEFFTVEEETPSVKPLVILAPGGGFSSYTEMPKLRQLATALAKRGYHAAIVKYYNGTHNYDTYVKAFHDIRSSVRYFKINAAQYKIDTANIFLGGWSSGATVSFSVAYLDSSEIASIGPAAHRTMFQNSVNNLGFDNSDNPGVSASVRGYIGMFTYSFDKNMIDRSDAAMMLINHWDAHFQDGTRIIGTYQYGGIAGYGTDPIAQNARQKGFVDGQDLEYIRIPGPSLYKGSNEAPLHHRYYPEIYDFIDRNLKR